MYTWESAITSGSFRTHYKAGFLRCEEKMCSNVLYEFNASSYIGDKRCTKFISHNSII